MKLIYQNYHKHTDDSNIMTPDSSVKIEEYAKRCVELGHKVLSGVEHGWQGQYYRTYEIAKKYNLKFIFGVEAYWVLDRLEKDDTNAHIVILARNENGRQQINDILSEANITGFYKKPRVDLNLILSLNPNDVFITSACVAFWKYGNMEEIILKLHNHFGENFMLEIQYHNTIQQINLNKNIKKLAEKYGIKMILGTDSHYIYPQQAQDREEILNAKCIHYEDESGWYLDYPDGEEAYNRLKNQNIFTNEEILSFFENTNVLLEFDDIKFDDNIKLPSLYPSLTQKEKNKIYNDLLVTEWNKIKETIPKDQHKKYIAEIKKEAKVVQNTGMADYFILDYHIVDKGKKNGGVITYTGRGSGSGFYTNTLLGFSNIDRVTSPVQLYPERFMSETRILETRSLPD